MFLNPLMLAGLGGAVLPLVLHLLSRARYRRIDFGAMMFLETARGRMHHGARLKQIVLLLVRMATLAVLAVALARPVIRTGPAAVGEAGRVSAVIILDRSASMSRDDNGRSNMEHAKSAVMNILATLRRGDTAAIITMGDLSADPVIQPTTDLQSLASRVDDISPSFGKADIAVALMQAARIFESDKNPGRELYIVCDRQAIGWNGIDEPFAAAWKRSVLRDGAEPRCFLLPIGTDDNENVAVESIHISGPPIVRGLPCEVEVSVSNFGQHARPAVPIAITTGTGRELYRGTVSLAAKASTTIAAPVMFAAAGSQVITARIETGGFKFDDELEYAVDILDPVKILVASAPGEPSAAPDFLTFAMEPYRSAGEQGADPAQVLIAADDQDLTSQRPDVIVLNDVPLLSAQTVRAVEQFVYTGGGLLIAPGALAQLENYNRLLFKDYTGLMPARLVAPTSADGSQATHIAQVDAQHPIFSFMRQRPMEMLPDAPIERWFQTADSVGARVLASYASGEPFLLERAYGRGHVALMTTPLRRSIGSEWNSLHRTNFYLPLMQSLVRWLVRPDAPARNLSIGQPIEAAISNPVRGPTAQLTLPGGAIRQVELVSAEHNAQIRYNNTQQPGRYTLRVPLADGDEQVLYFVVRRPLDEADPTPLSPQRLDWITQWLGLARIAETDKPAIAAAVGSRRTGRELFLPMIAVVGGLIVLEMALARAWATRG